MRGDGDPEPLLLVTDPQLATPLGEYLIGGLEILEGRGKDGGR